MILDFDRPSLNQWEIEIVFNDHSQIKGLISDCAQEQFAMIFSGYRGPFKLHISGIEYAFGFNDFRYLLLNKWV